MGKNTEEIKKYLERRLTEARKEEAKAREEHNDALTNEWYARGCELVLALNYLEEK